MVPARRLSPLPSWIPTPLTPYLTGHATAPSPRSTGDPLAATCPTLTPLPGDRRPGVPFEKAR